MSSQFSGTAPGGSVSGTRTVERRAEGLVVEYGLEWSGGDPVSVRLSDRIPTENVEEFGFHDEHEPSDWTAGDGELDLKTSLGPGSERTFVLGVVAECGEELCYDPSDPVLEVLEGDATDDVAGFSDRVRRSLDVDFLERDADSDDGGTSTGTGSIEGDGTDADPSCDHRHQAKAAPGRRRVDGGVVNTDTRGGVAAALIAELEEGEVPDSELATLRDHLDVERSEPEAVRLEYVQKRLGDFDAYVDALEDLLAVHGSGDDGITELEERLDGFVDDVESVRRRQGEMADRLDDLSDALDAQAETLESLRTAHEEDVDEVRTEIRHRGEVICEEFDDLQQSLDADLAALEAEVEAFESIRRTLVDGLQRPADPDAATTVEDADPDALAGTEEIPIVDPTGSSGAGPAVGPDDAVEDGDVSTAEMPAVDTDVEDRLETAEASNFSGAGSTADGTGSSTSDEGGTRRLSDDEFVHPVPDDVGGDPGEESGTEPAEDGVDGEAVEIPDPDGKDTGIPDPDGKDTGIPDSEGKDTGIPDFDGRDTAEDDPETGNTSGEEGDEAGDGASSIFEIGNVDTGGSGDEETPTIDFEDP